MSESNIILEFDSAKLARIERAFKSAPKIINKHLAGAVDEVVLKIDAFAKEHCPVDTGKLRASIKPHVVTWAEQYVGTNTSYAPHVEFGTENMDAQPFLEPAFEYGKEIAEKIFNDAVDAALTEIDGMI